MRQSNYLIVYGNRRRETPSECDDRYDSQIFYEQIIISVTRYKGSYNWCRRPVRFRQDNTFSNGIKGSSPIKNTGCIAVRHFRMLENRQRQWD